MIERRAIRIRLCPDAAQDLLFRKTGGCARLVRNLALEQRRTFARPGRWIGYCRQRAELAALKAAAPFLREVPHHCLQEALVDLDRAFASFFAGRAAYPAWQRKRDGVSFRFPDAKQFRLEGDTATPDKQRTRTIREIVLHLPKAGAVRAVLRRALPPGARLKSVTVSSDGGWWVASLLHEREVGLPEDRSHEPVTGIDLNVAQPVATSEGAVHALPGSASASGSASAGCSAAWRARRRGATTGGKRSARWPGTRPSRRASGGTRGRSSPRGSPRTIAAGGSDPVRSAEPAHAGGPAGAWSRWRASTCAT
jgi:hypothetical protein